MENSRVCRLADQFGHDGAVSGGVVVFEAEQAGAVGAGEGDGVGEVGLGFGGFELGGVDPVHGGDVAFSHGVAAGFGGAEAAQVGVGDADLGQGGFEEALGEAWFAGGRHGPHVEQMGDFGFA